MIENNNNSNEIESGGGIVQEFRNREKPETYTVWMCNDCGTTFGLDKSQCPDCFGRNAFEQEFVKGDSQ